MRKNIAASESAGVYIFAVCGSSILSYLFNLILLRTGSFAGMGVSAWVSYVVTQIAFVAVALLYARLRRYDLRAVARIYKFTDWKRWLLLPFITIAAVMTFLPLSMLFTRLLALLNFGGYTVSMPDYDNFGVYVLALLIMAVLPAIGEEVVVRGSLVPGLSTRGVGFAVFVSALLFSLMHANPLQTVHQFGLGIVLAVVFMLSKSIVPCVFIHFFNNFISITTTAYLPQIDRAVASLGYYQYLTGAASVVVGALLLTILLFIYHRLGRQGSRKPFRVVDNGVVFDEFTLYVSSEDDSRRLRAKENVLADSFRFVGSLFTKNGWRKVSDELSASMGEPYIGRAQPMISVWLAIGFAAVYWLFALIRGFII